MCVWVCVCVCNSPRSPAGHPASLFPLRWELRARGPIFGLDWDHSHTQHTGTARPQTLALHPLVLICCYHDKTVRVWCNQRLWDYRWGLPQSTRDRRGNGSGGIGVKSVMRHLYVTDFTLFRSVFFKSLTSSSNILSVIKDTIIIFVFGDLLFSYEHNVMLLATYKKE